MTLPGAASIPAADSRHAIMAAQTGKRAVAMVWDDLKPSDLITENAIHNAVAAVLAIGGSTKRRRASHRARAPGGARARFSTSSTRVARATPLLANTARPANI